MTQGKVRAVYGIDSQYVVPAAVSIHSLAEHTAAPVEIIVFGDGLTPSGQRALHRAASASGADIDIRPFDPPGLSDYRRDSRARYPAIVTLPMWLPWLIDGRCLFIDADTLVMRDASDLMETDLR